jgi:hypothetical protein
MQPLFDHLIGKRNDRKRNGQSERACRLQIDEEVDLRLLLYWQLSGFLTLEYPPPYLR